MVTVALMLFAQRNLPSSNVASASERRFGLAIDDLPAGVVTRTSTAFLPGGVTAEIDVSLSTVNERAFADPNETAVAPLKPPPLMVTRVPPRSVPCLGETEFTVGGKRL